MTLERPVYRVTVHNDDQGWTQTAEHGETPPLITDVTAFLMDDFQMGWGLEGDQAPAKLAADTCTFKIFCRTAADLPAIEVGDVLLVNLDRVGPSGLLIPYMHFVGRASEPEATATPGHGIELQVSATGFLVDLSPEVDLGNDSTVTSQTEGYLMNLVRDQAGVSAIFHSPAAFTRAVRPFGQMSAQEAADRLLAGAANADRGAVLRAAYKWAQWDASGIVHPNNGLPAGWSGYEGDNPDLAFYMQEWLLHLPAPLTLIASAADPDVVTLGPDAATLDQVATIPSSVCRVPADWSKSRGDLVNTTTLVYPATDGAGLKEAKITVKDAASIARYGPAPREIQTFITPGSSATVAGVYQNPAPGTLAWSIPSLQVLPELMEDYQLDELAPTFYPHAEPIGSTAGRFIILTDLDEDTAVAGRDVAMQVTGATFGISGGRLTIGLSVRAVPPPSLATSITWADLAAGPLADTAWTDAGGHYIDPSLDWDELTYTDA